jgi:hypothetical protein
MWGYYWPGHDFHQAGTQGSPHPTTDGDFLWEVK